MRLDLEGFTKNLKREGTPSRVYLFEHGLGGEMKETLARQYSLADMPGDAKAAWSADSAVHRFLGQEVFRVSLPGYGYSIPGNSRWENQHSGPIQSWQGFELYPWPRVRDVDFSQLEYYERNLFDNMAVFHKVAIWEVVRKLFGFEDAIESVTKAKTLWGNRIALLGGLDVDYVASHSEQEVRDYSRSILDSCLPGGGFFLGMGNWVTSYIPVENYLAVIEEARRYRP